MLKGLSQNARVALLGSVGAALAFFVFGGARGAGGGASDPLDAVPRDSFLVATANLAELRRSPLYEVLLGKDPTGPRGARGGAQAVLDPRQLGMGRLADACGFDPLSRVERLAVAVPEEGDRGELGVAARVVVTSDELSRCTKALADLRSGKVETKEVGSYAVVEGPVTAAPGVGSARPRVAYGRGGLFVAGQGAWFDAMLAASDHKAAGLREAPAHVAMRTSLTSHPSWGAPTLLVSAVLPRSLRDRIKTEMGAEVGAKDASSNIMGGVLGVSVAGAALKAGATGQSLELAVELLCDEDAGGGGAGTVKDETAGVEARGARSAEHAEGIGGVGGEAPDLEACALVEKLILKKRFEWSKELTLRMVGLGPLLDSIQVERQGKRVRVTAAAASDALADTLERVLRFQARRRDDSRPTGDASDPSPKPDDKPTRPYEIVPAPRSSPSH